MSGAPETTNTAANVVDSILRGLFKLGLLAAEAAETAAVPELKVWPLSWIIDAVQSKIFDSIRKALSLESTYFIIDFQSDLERAHFADAVRSLQAAIAKGDLNDPELIKKMQDVKDKFDRLVSWDGSFSP